MATLFQHPDYVLRRPHWQRYSDMYKGDHQVMVRQEYLWPHTQELMRDADGYSAQLRTARELHTRYLNIPEIMVSLLTSFFFREAPELDELSQRMLEADGALDDIDGNGTSFYGFIKDRILKNYLIYGKPIVLVDAFSGEAQSEGQRRAMGLRPYMEVLEPLCVVDWDFESRDPARLGRLNMLRHEYSIIEPRTLSTKPVTRRYSDTLTLDGGRYTIVRDTVRADTTESKVKTPEGEQWERLEVINTKLSEIPVSLIDTESWLKDVCEETLRHYNLRSSKDNIEYYQSYQKIFVSGVTTPEQIKALSENIVAILPNGATWGSIEPVDTAGLERSIQQAVDNAFKMGLNLGRTLPADSRAGQAEGAQTEEKKSTYSLVESSLDDIETLVNDSLDDYAEFKGIQNFEGAVTLSREIAEKDFTEFVTLWNAFRDALKGSEIVNRAALKKVIEKLDLGITPEDLQMAVEEAAQIKEQVAPARSPLSGFLNSAE